MRLDVGTLAYSTAMLSLALSATTAVIALGRGDRLIRFCFTGSTAFYGAGLLIIVFFGHARPGVSIIGNAMVMVSAIFAHLGACAYAGRKVNPIYYALILPIVVVALSASLALGGYGAPMRVYIISAGRIPLFVHAAYTLSMYRREDGDSISKKLLISMFLSFSFALVVRIFDLALSEFDGQLFLDWGGFQSSYYIFVAFIMLSMSIAFAFMCAEEDEKHLRRTIELKTAELREAKAAAERASAAKTRFIGAAGHDLRQPVHALRLLASAALGLVPPKNEELSGLIADMAKSTAQLSEYLHALMDISKLDAGVVVPEVRDVDIGDLFTDLELQFRQEAIAADVSLQFVRSSAVVLADPFLLKRILANLISNAVKFAEGGTVLVGCRHRRGGIEIQVCDNGCGIDGIAIPIIFDEFRQIGNDARQSTKGIGIGLCIVQRLCSLLHYTISVRSRPGEGSVFGVTIPLDVGHSVK